jgi:hypothetical protein
MSRTRITAAAVALAAAALVTGCTGGGSGDGASAGIRTTDLGAAGPTATRWWSNSAVSAGSVIDVQHPQAAAAKLHESQQDYCGMLRDTVRADKSIMPGVGATDPTLVASTKAFVSELERVAPSPVARSWQVLGDVVLKLVASGGDLSKVKGVDQAAVQRAGTAVAAHAKSTCHVNVSAVRP